MMSEHETVRDLLPLAAAGVLDAEEQSRVEAHLNGCPVCRDELTTWNLYAGGLRELPRVEVPPYLLERTRTRILQGRAAQSEDRQSPAFLVFLALLGWSVNLAVWMLVRLLVSEAAVLRPDVWLLLSTLFAWGTGATAAIVLVRGQKVWRTVL
jgi:anti-sigma factor RsiW